MVVLRIGTYAAAFTDVDTAVHIAEALAGGVYVVTDYAGGYMETAASLEIAVILNAKVAPLAAPPLAEPLATLAEAVQ